MRLHHLLWPVVFVVLAGVGAAPAPSGNEQEEADLVRHFIQPGQLKRLVIETPLVVGGKAQAFLAVPDEDAYRRRAERVNAVLREMAGVELPVRPAAQVSDADLAAGNALLLGHLENNPVIARLYHSYYDCLDTGYTGKGGFEIRTVHDPFGNGRNCVVVGGSDESGADAAVTAFLGIAREQARGKDVVLPRLLRLSFRAAGRYGTVPDRLSADEAKRVVESDLSVYDKPGVGRSAAHALVRHAMLYHRYGDPAELEIYRRLIGRHIRFYAEDPWVRTSMRRYDRDFRDSWAWKVVVSWDLLEEDPLFTDAERVAITNHCLRLVQECVLYQGWDRPGQLERWAKNRDIVHNHHSWPALGCYFGARYFGKYYRHPYAKDWQTIADGCFNGQKLCSKPLEDAASYQWLPLRHTIIWSLASGDLTFLKEGHARRAAETALMLTDNLGNQPAFGDHTDWTSTAAIPDLLGRCAWYYRDGRYLWGAERAGGNLAGELLETYFPPVAPQPAGDHVGVVAARLPRQNYDSCAGGSQYATAPNQPFEAAFDKVTLRGGLEPDDQYLLLDGFGRGNHMHFDANALIHFADRGACWIVDGEYIRNTPKYHTSVTVLREGQSALLPAVAALDRHVDLARTGFVTSRIAGYNGAAWGRSLVWLKGRYFVVLDQVSAERKGEFTLGSAWRVLGEPELRGDTLVARQRDRSFALVSVDGLAGDLRFQRGAGEWPIHALTRRLSRKMAVGESVTFRNLFYASSPERPQAFTAAAAGTTGVLVTGGGQAAWCGASPAKTSSRLGNVETDAALFRIAADGFALAGATRLSAGADLFRADHPVDIEVDAGSGEGVVVAAQPTALVLRVGAGSPAEAGPAKATAGPDGMLRLSLPAGRHGLRTKPFALPDTLRQSMQKDPRPAAGGAPAATAAAGSKSLPKWEFSAFTTERRPLLVKAVAATAEPYGRYAPLEKLIDRRYTSSTQSVMWAVGVTPVVTLDLGSRRAIESLRLRAWELNETQRLGRCVVELSDDGFDKDVRRVPAGIAPAGTEAFGNNINHLYSVAVNAEARWVRLTPAPAGEKGQVYLAEVELFGNDPGVRATITALAAGSLGADGVPAAVAATASGQIVAVDAAGKLLWEHRAPGRVNALAVADLDGDGRPEVIAGGAPAWLRCLDAAGQQRWEHRPAAYRGIAGQVTALAVGDLEGDGKPEVVAGLLCWKYIAVDAAGKEKWDTIFYAHGATAGALVDVDGVGKRSVVAGNAYYRLNLLGPDGAVRWQNYTFGPEHTCVTGADLNGDGKEEILAGSDLGEFHALSGKGERLWAQNVGDAVRAILTYRSAAGARPEVYAAGESGFVYACTAEGKLRWKRPAGDSIGAAVLADLDGAGRPHIVAAAGSAGVVLFRRDGSVARRLRADAPASLVAVLPGKKPSVVAALADGRLVGW